MQSIAPYELLQPKRKIQGVSAMLLPYANSEGVGKREIDWKAFHSLLERTLSAGLVPAVNMDTGYANLLEESERQAVLRTTQEVCAGRAYAAGAFVADKPGALFDLASYRKQIDTITNHGGLPIIFQSYGLAYPEHPEPDEQITINYQRIAQCCDQFIAFELGQMFAPFGKIYSIDTYKALMQIPQCIGAKHSSLRRELEWERLALRNKVRPDFRVYTGNDLAIDMVIYGSDYLLGLSAFAPDLFAKRDALWEAGDPAWNELNDYLQYLGHIAFRAPVPAYKHSAAIFLHRRGWLPTDLSHPRSPTRTDADREILCQLADQADSYL